VFIPFTVGGGIRRVDDARLLLRAGADKVSVNTSAVERPALIGELAAEYGAQCVVCAIDAKARPDGRGWEVYVHGGRTAHLAGTRWRGPRRPCVWRRGDPADLDGPRRHP
jgi:cyclase